MAKDRLVLVVVAVALASEGCAAAVGKLYSRPLKFRFTGEDQETSATKHEGEHLPNNDSGESRHYDEHHHDSGEKDDKSYEDHHERDEEEKGHLDKTNRKQHIAEEKGHSDRELDEHKHVTDEHVGEKSKKSEKYDESSKYHKGHSTKGEHNVVKKDNYEKKHDFYDEFHDDDEHERHEEHHGDHGARQEGHCQTERDSKEVLKEQGEKRGNHHLGKQSHHVESHYNDGAHKHRSDHSGKFAGKDGSVGLGKIWIYRL
ncbi:histidine-rich glycoprotein-like [Copidosoma floridanum]|uniref:histidine-rich glycoprotein-like n=1 Tax=Copidosoma floridanum TaxID=29053 RepID=UPI0006C9AE27|nr:histidine-rich glycoprotein-like [Copidosoma floridanum]